MIDPLQKIFDDLEVSRARFMDTLKGLDEVQLSFRPRSDSWSALEVAEHVLIAEQLSTETMLRLAGRRSRSRTLLQRLGYAAVWAVLKLRLRVNTPSRVLQPSGGMTLRQIAAEWDASRARLRSYFEDLEPAALEHAGFGHPVAGPMNLREALLFLLRHTRHHQEQLERIKHHARFPAAQAALSAGAG